MAISKAKAVSNSISTAHHIPVILEDFYKPFREGTCEAGHCLHLAMLIYPPMNGAETGGTSICGYEHVLRRRAERALANGRVMRRIFILLCDLPSMREIHAPRGKKLNAKSWQTEAPLRLLMNNLDPEVAKDPAHLIVYGGTGRAARNWESFDAIVKTLKEMDEDETLLVQSGKPVAVFKTNEWGNNACCKYWSCGGKCSCYGCYCFTGYAKTRI
jgi:hypothetical protein